MKIAGWFLLLALGIILVDVGWRGKFGSAMAALITPAQLKDVTG